MKLNVKAFSIALSIVLTAPFLALFIWCSINGFGSDLVRIFESVHPSGGFTVIETIPRPFWMKIVAILINTFYVMIDSFFAGFIFSNLYNFFTPKNKS